MRTSVALAAVLFASAFAPVPLRADELFSKVAIDGVFASAEEHRTTAGEPRPADTKDAARPILGVDSLSGALRTAGFEPTAKGPQTLLVQLERGGAKLPVALTISGDAQQLRITMPLNEQPSDREIPAEKLLQLLAANQNLAPRFFAYSKSRRSAELCQVLSGSEVATADLKTLLERLAETAEGTRALWDFAGGSAAASAAAPVASVQDAGSLVGTWSATVSEQAAFALQLGGDGKFVLVHANRGKTTRSAGTFALSNGQLALNGDERSQIRGTVQVKSQDEFRFVPASTGGKPLTFKRAK